MPCFRFLRALIVDEGSQFSGRRPPGLLKAYDHAFGPFPQAVLIVGSGQEAVTLALSAFERGATEVSLVSRGPLRTQEFDVDVGWFGAGTERSFPTWLISRCLDRCWLPPR